MSAGTRVAIFVVIAALAIFAFAYYANKRMENAPISESEVAENSSHTQDVASPSPPPPKPQPKQQPKPQPVEEVQWVTLDGTENGQVMVRTINLWKDYNNRSRGTVGSARHGERVKLIRESGEGVLVETSSGTRGWVTYYFVKELK
jgi:hypothetical protein